MNHYILRVFLLILAGLTGLLAGQDSRPATKSLSLDEKIRSLCRQVCEDKGVVGVRVCIARKDQPILDLGFGLSDRETQRPVTRETVFRLGSISKPVTALLVMKEVEAGRLDLDRDIHDYCSDLGPELPRMTLRHILSHTSGIRHYRADRLDNTTLRRSTREALDLFVKDELIAEPGSRYSYSTHAYTLAAHVLECRTGRSFPDLVRKEIAGDQLPSLACEDITVDKPQRTRLYNLKDGELVAEAQKQAEDNSWKFAGGGMESTTEDLAKFGELMLRDVLIRRDSRDVLWTATRLTDGTTKNYGLGWSLDPANQQVFHSGSQQGCNTMLLIDESQHLVVAVMMNTLGGGAPALARRVHELCSGK